MVVVFSTAAPCSVVILVSRAHVAEVGSEGGRL